MLKEEWEYSHVASPYVLGRDLSTLEGINNKVTVTLAASVLVVLAMTSAASAR